MISIWLAIYDVARTFILRKTLLPFGNGRRFGLDFKRSLTCCLIVVLAISVAVPSYFLLKDKSANPRPSYCTFEVVNAYPHNDNAFTEGLVFEDGVLYESTGLNGYSTLRRVELQTGRILQLHSLPNQFFGEGITIFDNRIFQLTWLSHKGFVYDKTSFDLLGEFNYSTEGWGITNDGSRLIMSDGTANLYFLNPETFERIGQVEVRDNLGPVTELNELEYVNGSVYANIWLQEKIAIINPQTGQVKTWIDLTGIQSMVNRSGDDVLNGIAYDASENRLFITGKRWPQLFEIKLVALQ